MSRAAAFILTHRRGCGLGIWDKHSPNGQFKGKVPAQKLAVTRRMKDWASLAGIQIEPAFDQSDLCGLAELETLFRIKVLDDARMEGKVGGFSYFFTGFPTAESLSAGYRHVLALAGLSDIDVDELILSVGPSGSFTGLRVGAAFASGLQMGRNRTLLHCPTLDPGVLANLIEPETDLMVEGESIRSAFSSPVQPLELWFALASYLGRLISTGQAEDLRYASLPGPVLLYRRKQGLD